MIEVMLAATALVLLMQCGFLLVFAGFARARNVTHTVIASLLLSSVALLGFWATGYAIQQHGAVFLRTVVAPAEYGTFVFFGTIASLTAVLIAGALMERWRYASIAVTALVLSAVVFPLIGRWAWHDGWLARRGFFDFAGSGVIHLAAGSVALAGALVVGPRARKFGHDRQPQAMPGHHVPMFMAAGVLILVGWVGIVMGMELPHHATEPLALAAANGVLGCSASVLTALLYMRWRLGGPDPSLVANAWLAGLVSVSGGAVLFSPIAAVIVAAIGGLLVILSVLFFERTVRVDDPAGVISVHGTCGLWGLVAAALFASEPVSFVTQLLGAAVILVFAFGSGYVLFQILERTIGNRVNPASEMEGLDVAELGTTAYPDFGGAPHDSGR